MNKYNIPKSPRQPIQVVFFYWLKMYAELAGDSKKQRIKSHCDNNIDLLNMAQASTAQQAEVGSHRGRTTQQS